MPQARRTPRTRVQQSNEPVSLAAASFLNLPRMWLQVRGFREASFRLGYSHSASSSTLWPPGDYPTLRIAWDLEAWLQQALVAEPLTPALALRPADRAAWQVIDDCALLNAYGWLSPSFIERAIADLERWLSALGREVHEPPGTGRGPHLQVVLLAPSSHYIHWGAQLQHFRKQEHQQRQALEKAWNLLKIGTSTGDQAALRAGKRRMAAIQRLVYPRSVWWQLQQALLQHDWKGARLDFLDPAIDLDVPEVPTWLVAADLYAAGLVDGVYAPHREALVLANAPGALLLLRNRQKLLENDRFVSLIDIIAGWPLDFGRYGALACAISGLDPFCRPHWSMARSGASSMSFEEAMARAQSMLLGQPDNDSTAPANEHVEDERTALKCVTFVISGSASMWSHTAPMSGEHPRRHAFALESAALESSPVPGEKTVSANVPGTVTAESYATLTPGQAPDVAPEASRDAADTFPTPTAVTSFGETLTGTRLNESTPTRAGCERWTADPVVTPTSAGDASNQGKQQATSNKLGASSPVTTRSSVAETSRTNPEQEALRWHQHIWLPVIDTPYLRRLSEQILGWRRANDTQGSLSLWFQHRRYTWQASQGRSLRATLSQLPHWLQRVLVRARLTDKVPLIQGLEKLVLPKAKSSSEVSSAVLLWPWALLLLSLALGWFATDADHWHDRVVWWVFPDSVLGGETNASAWTNYLVKNWPPFLAEQIAASEIMNLILGVELPGLHLASCLTLEVYAQLRVAFTESYRSIRCYLDEGTWRALEALLSETLKPVQKQAPASEHHAQHAL